MYVYSIYVCMHACMYVCMYEGLGYHDSLRVFDGLGGQVFPFQREKQLGLLRAPAAGHRKGPAVYRTVQRYLSRYMYVCLYVCMYVHMNYMKVSMTV